MKSFQSVDKICEKYIGRRVKIMCKILDDMVLLEGDKKSLEFLGNLIIAQANSKDCGFFLTPKGPGNKLFYANSEKGIYIHRRPCKSLPTCAK